MTRASRPPKTPAAPAAARKTTRVPPPADVIRIVLADDHLEWRTALRNLLAGEPDFEIVGEASTPDEAVAVCERTLPDVLLLDVGMAGGGGLDVLERLRPLRLGARILMMTTQIARPDLVRTLQLGAYGVVLRETTPDLLFKSIRRVRAGEFWVGREMVADLVHALSAREDIDRPPILRAPRAFALSPRELQIVSAVASGYTDAQMAEKFGIPVDAVTQHVGAIFKKTGVENRLELALFAIHHRLTQGDAP